MTCSMVGAGIPQQVLAAARWQVFFTIAAFSCFLGKSCMHAHIGGTAYHDRYAVKC